MIRIVPADAAEIECLREREHLAAPVSAMMLSDETGEQGYVLFRLEKDTIELLVLRASDPGQEEWLLRAALNVGVNRNAVTGFSRNPNLFLLLRSLGFREDGDGWSIFLPSFFTSPCSGRTIL